MLVSQQRLDGERQRRHGDFYGVLYHANQQNSSDVLCSISGQRRRSTAAILIDGQGALVAGTAAPRSASTTTRSTRCARSAAPGIVQNTWRELKPAAERGRRRRPDPPLGSRAHAPRRRRRPSSAGSSSDRSSTSSRGACRAASRSSHPGSHCPAATTPVKPYDNIPVLSWLLLRGRCRSCGEPISRALPARRGSRRRRCTPPSSPTTDDVAGARRSGSLLVTFLVPIALIDLDHRIIPNKLTLPAPCWRSSRSWRSTSTSSLEHAHRRRGRRRRSSSSPRWPTRAGMGMGDVKLAGVLGLYLGRAVAPAIFIALIAGVVVGAVDHRPQGAPRPAARPRCPFGPFLALGGVIALLRGRRPRRLVPRTF